MTHLPFRRLRDENVELERRAHQLERTVDALLKENDRLRGELRGALDRTNLTERESADPKAGACGVLGEYLCPRSCAREGRCAWNPA